MKNLKLISLIGFIKPKIKNGNFMLFSTINMTKLEINNILADYYNFTNTLKMNSFQTSSAFQTKTSIMKLALLIIKNITQLKGFYLLIRKKQIINNCNFAWFQLWYSFIEDKNKKRGQSFTKLDLIFDVTLKTLKKRLLKEFFKKTQKFILFLKQKMKQNFVNKFSFLIKTLNFKIINMFKFFGTFFNLFDCFQKIIYIMCRQKKFFFNQQVRFVKLQWVLNKTQKILVDRFYEVKKCEHHQFYKSTKNILCFKIDFLKENVYFDFCLQKFYKKFGKTKYHPGEKNKINIWYNRYINNIHFKLRRPLITDLKAIFNKIMRSIKMLFNQQDFFIVISSCFTKIKKIVLKLASFVTFFLYKFLWKSAKKQNPKISNKCLVNNYCIFLQKLAIFYFFKKRNIDLRNKVYTKSTVYL
jgi:hypothetical protein